MGRFLLLLCLYAISNISSALYEDEVGVFDWKQRYVGRVKFIYFDQSSQSGKRIIVATEDNALAVINTRTGGIVWRHLFEEPIDHLLHQKSLLVSISSGGTLLRSWDVVLGYLQWETAIQSSHDPNSRDYQSMQVDSGWGSGEVKVALAENLILVLANDKLTAIGSKRGDKLWSIEISSGNDHRAIHPMGDHMLVFSIKDQSLLVLSKYSITDGQLISTRVTCDCGTVYWELSTKEDLRDSVDSHSVREKISVESRFSDSVMYYLKNDARKHSQMHQDS